MMAIRMEPNERQLVNLYDSPEPRLRLSRKSVLAFTAVGIFYAGLGLLVVTQQVVIPAIAPKQAEPIVVESIREKPPEPERKVAEQVPPIHHPAPTTIPAPPENTLPVAPPEHPFVDQGQIVTTLPVTPMPGPYLAPDPAPTPVPTVIRNPTWLSKPTSRQLENLYPRRALDDEKSGAATLACTVAANGSMGVCTVVDESPKGYRFGEAALAASKYFKMSPRTVDGQPVEGAKVRIPMVFNLG